MPPYYGAQVPRDGVHEALVFRPTPMGSRPRRKRHVPPSIHRPHMMPNGPKLAHQSSAPVFSPVVATKAHTSHVQPTYESGVRDLPHHTGTITNPHKSAIVSVPGIHQSGKFPSIAHLICKYPYGRPTLAISFVSEVVFEHIIIFLLRSTTLRDEELSQLSRVHPLFEHLIRCVHLPQHTEFSHLQIPHPNYDTQEAIPMKRTLMLRDLAIGLNFHLPSVIRYLGHDYMGEHLPRKSLLTRVTPFLDDGLMTDLRRVLFKGSPAVLQGQSSHANFWKYKR